MMAVYRRLVRHEQSLRRHAESVERADARVSILHGGRVASCGPARRSFRFVPAVRVFERMRCQVARWRRVRTTEVLSFGILTMTAVRCGFARCCLFVMTIGGMASL